jgi:hypothetical protein
MIDSPLFAVLLCLLAGSCAYLYFLNRYLIELKDRGRKFPVIASTLAATLVGSILFGAAAAGTPWMIAPGIVLAATARCAGPSSAGAAAVRPPWRRKTAVHRWPGR